MPDPQARKPARPQAKKSAGPPPGKIGRQVTLSAESWRWLEVHALGRGCSISELVERWVSQQPSEYVLTHRPPRAAAEEPTATPLAIADLEKAG